MTATDRKRLCRATSVRCTGLDIEEGANERAYWKGLVTSRACLLILLILGLPSLLRAQKEKGSWSDLNGLKAGQGIDVVESNMKSHGGEFVAITEEAITLREKGTDVSVKRENVARVSTASGARRGEHAVIGLLVGAGMGAAIGALAGSRSKGWVGLSEGVGALVGIATGGTGGAIVGAVIPAHTTIYRRVPENPHPTTSP